MSAKSSREYVMNRICLLLAVAMVLSACNTAQGVKKDVAIGAEKTGEALHKGGEAVGEALHKGGVTPAQLKSAAEAMIALLAAG